MQNRDTPMHLCVLLEYCLFFTVRALPLIFPFTWEEDQGSQPGLCGFCISPSSRSLFWSFLKQDHFSLVALKLLPVFAKEHQKVLLVSLKSWVNYFFLDCILLFPRKSVWPFLLFYLFFNFLSFEEEWTSSHKMWLYIVPFSQGQMSLKQAPKACWTQAFSRRWTECCLYVCDYPF